MPFRPPSDEEIADREKRDRKKRIEEYARSNPPDPSYDDPSLKMKHRKSVYDEATKGMPTGEKDQSYLKEITKPMDQREKERKKKKEPKVKATAHSQDDGFEEYRSRRMKGEDVTIEDIQDREEPASKKEKKSWTEKKLDRKRTRDEIAEIDERAKDRKERARERKHAEEMRRIEEKQARTELAKSRREARQSSGRSSYSSSYDDYEEPPRKTSKKAIAGAVAADVGLGLLTGESFGLTEAVTGGRKKPRSTGSKAKPKSSTSSKPKSPQSKPKTRSTGSKTATKGKSTRKKKTTSKGKGTQKKGTQKKGSTRKKSPPKKGSGGGGMFWSYGDAGL